MDVLRRNPSRVVVDLEAEMSESRVPFLWTP
jgi:hypothetical protein